MKLDWNSNIECFKVSFFRMSQMLNNTALYIGILMTLCNVQDASSLSRKECFVKCVKPCYMNPDYTMNKGDCSDCCFVVGDFEMNMYK